MLSASLHVHRSISRFNFWRGRHRPCCLSNRRPRRPFRFARALRPTQQRQVLSDGLIAILANSRDPSLPVTTHNNSFSFLQTDTYSSAALCLSTATLSSRLLLRYSIEISRSPLQISPNSFSSQIHYRKLDKEITRFLQAMRQTACSEE
ncbi:hypothetical protein CRG98_040723 [Punica granatum]|uniref:Uncharacterized protein n=1 Tax=Punica granatum TaxID=22663 RepID=A0A2I0I4Z0_PUNGR|nr:hypothetical protein CRG98_040723 [Punica granatum]